MEVKKFSITIRELCEGYINESETQIENAVTAYGGKLCVRPAFQRAFVYKKKEENAVVDTALKGFPLNIMYWADNGDGTYDCMDGQQRTISLCNFVDASSSFSAPWFNNGRKTYIHTLQRVDPDRYERFMNYELEVYICSGSKTERMEWFRTINIAGAELSPQELRNTNYTSAWLTDAKRYFSKASPNAKCPAEHVGGGYTNKNANRQEILEQVIGWYVNSDTDEAICQYMEDCMTAPDATELWNYFNNVISWAKSLFPGVYDKGMASVNWGRLYNEYHDKDFNAEELCTELEKLIDFKASKELTSSMAKIIEYCITRDWTLLSHREFTDIQRTALYNRQNHICPDCGEHFLKNDMEAHHIVSWYNGGVTEMSNGVMLCKACHNKRHTT